NAGGTGTLTLALPITPAPPVITIPGMSTGQVGVAFIYPLSLHDALPIFGASGLPASLTINSTTGLISGTPTTAGTSTVTLSATNTGRTDTRTPATSPNPTPSSISSHGTATGQVGVAFSYQMTATNTPTSF